MQLNRTIPSPVSLQRISCGFNLIEAAIVLGLIGLVIGGIWVAASAVSENMRRADAGKGILSIVQGVRNLYGSGAPTSTSRVEAAMINAGVVPGDWVSGTQIRGPFNNMVWIETGPDRVSVAMHSVPRAACVELLSRITTSVSNPSEITTNVNCDAPIAGLVSVSQAQTRCAYDTNSISWNFGLKGGPPTGYMGLCS